MTLDVSNSLLAVLEVLPAALDADVLMPIFAVRTSRKDEGSGGVGASHLLDAKLVVHNLHQGREAIGGAARVGNNILRVSRTESAVSCILIASSNCLQVLSTPRQ